MTYLGARLCVARAAPLNPVEGAGLIEKAARAGAGDAAHMMAVLSANGVGTAQSWSAAVDWLAKAEHLGDPRAAPQRAVIGADVSDWLAPPSADPVRPDPRIGVARGFIPEQACDWLIERARGRLKHARVYKPGETPGASDIRTNSGAGFTLFDGDVVLALVRARIAALLAAPLAHLEPTNVLHYALGQTFDHHFDFLNPVEPAFVHTIAREGQRIATFLIYLNDDYEGGETDFPDLAYRFKGTKGDALFFFSVKPDGLVDPRTLHAGLPPTRGEKWLLSQWIRSRPQPVA